MLYGCLLAVLWLGLAVLPAQADKLDALFEDDLARFTTDAKPLVNGPFIGVDTRLQVHQALNKPQQHDMIVTGSKIKNGPQDIAINSLVLEPGGPPIPPSVRKITIYGGELENVTVSGPRRPK